MSAVDKINEMIKATDERRLNFQRNKKFIEAAACAIRIRALQDALKAIGG